MAKDVRSSMGHKEAESKFRRLWRSLKRECDVTKKKQNPVKCAPSSPCAPRFNAPEWNLVHGFYAIMGGFATSTTKDDHLPDGAPVSSNFLPGSRARLILTSQGLRFLLEHNVGLLPQLSEEEIQDKSKADGVKKTLVCTQALWFVLSCLTRLANNLPISLLELNALAHATCALVIYAMWWHKPLDVEEPTILRDDSDGSLAQLAAYMWMGSEESMEGIEKWNWNTWMRNGFDALWPVGPPVVKDLLIGHCPADLTDACAYDAGITGYMSSDELQHLPKWHPFNQCYPAHGRPAEAIEWPFTLRKYLHPSFLRQRLRYPYKYSTHPTASRSTAAITHVSPATIQRWRLAYAAIDRFALNADLRTRHATMAIFFHDPDRLKKRIPNHLTVLSSKVVDAWFGFVLAGFAYGGLHLLAWDGAFWTLAEKILWRISSSSIVGSAAILAPVLALFEIECLNIGLKNLWRLGRANHLKRMTGWKYWFYMGLVVCILPVVIFSPLLFFSYVLGRVFLVVECFINLAYLPPGAFEDVGWPAWIPHIS